MACVGDSYNDLSMFALTPNSYVMKQSEKVIQGHGQHLTESVADFIQQVP